MINYSMIQMVFIVLGFVVNCNLANYEFLIKSLSVQTHTSDRKQGSL